MTDSRSSTAATLLGFGLAAAVIQVIATVKLGLASVDALGRAESEGARLYLVFALLSIVAGLAFWSLRRRPGLGFAAALAIELPTILLLRRHITGLGLAFYGEFILHHFLTLIAASTCLAVVIRWMIQRELGWPRWMLGGLVTVSTTALLVAHLAQSRGVELPTPASTQALGSGGLLLGSVLALTIAWRRADEQLRWLTLLLLLPVALRVASAWPHGLTGGSIPESMRTIVMATVVVGAVSTFAVFRPDSPSAVKGLVLTLSGLGTVLLYLIYQRSFGRLEDGIGGLAQSLFAFPLPYPEAVASWKSLALALSLFCMFAAVYGGLLSWTDRSRGVALGMMLITGLGLSNPQLVLMAVAAHFVWIDELLGPPPTPFKAPPTAMEDLLAAVAERLGLPEPVVLETAQGSVVALRGELDGTSIDVRARPLPVGWSLSIEAGVRGRGRAETELLPDATGAGPRPAHNLRDTHRVRGSARQLEVLGDDILDALLPFPDARARFWSAGSDVELGRDLSRCEPDVLVAVLRSFARDGVELSR